MGKYAFKCASEFDDLLNNEYDYSVLENFRNTYSNKPLEGEFTCKKPFFGKTEVDKALITLFNIELD